MVLAFAGDSTIIKAFDSLDTSCSSGNITLICLIVKAMRPNHLTDTLNLADVSGFAFTHLYSLIQGYQLER